MGKIQEGILLRKSSVYRNDVPQPICIFFVVIISIIIFLSSNIYYKMIFIEIWIFRRIQIKCVFWKIFDVVLYYSPWHRPLLAQPGPWREAIHCAFLSSFICSSILIATCLLLAAGTWRSTRWPPNGSPRLGSLSTRRQEPRLHGDHHAGFCIPMTYLPTLCRTMLLAPSRR